MVQIQTPFINACDVLAKEAGVADDAEASPHARDTYRLDYILKELVQKTLVGWHFVYKPVKTC